MRRTSVSTCGAIAYRVAHLRGERLPAYLCCRFGGCHHLESYLLLGGLCRGILLDVQVVHSKVARRIAVAGLDGKLKRLDLTERGEIDPLPVVDQLALLIAIVDEWYLDLVAIVSRDGHDKEATLLKGGTTEVLVALGSEAS